MNKEMLKKKLLNKGLLFYICVLAFPVVQFTIFYVVVNFNSIMLAFKQYTVDKVTLQSSYKWIGFGNFAQVFRDMFGKSGNLPMYFKNSLILYAASTFVGLPCALLFSFYIYKKRFGSGAYKFMLFLPSIISSMIMVTIFSYMVERAVPEVFFKLFNKQIMPPLSQLNTAFSVVVFYCVWVSFGTGILMYTGAMTRIPVSIVESAQLDGAGDLREFFSITLPLIFPTVSTFLTVGIVGIFIEQGNIHAFYGSGAYDNVQTVGYFLFIQVAGSNATIETYPYASAAGLFFTAIAIPLTLLVRKGLDKITPEVAF